jgi:hypothetical protein
MRLGWWWVYAEDGKVILGLGQSFGTKEYKFWLSRKDALFLSRQLKDWANSMKTSEPKGRTK